MALTPADYADPRCVWVQAANLIKSMHLRILESSGLHETLQPHRPFAKQKNQSIGHAPTLGPCYETTGIAQHLKYPVGDPLVRYWWSRRYR